MHTVKWCQTGAMFATGGADRKIQLWDVNNGEHLSLYILCYKFLVVLVGYELFNIIVHGSLKANKIHNNLHIVYDCFI